MKYKQFRHYIKIFFMEAKCFGLKSALNKVILKVLREVGSITRSKAVECISKDTELIDLSNLETRGVINQNLVMIITDTMIDQCLTYRVNQKADVLKNFSCIVKVFRSNEAGRISSFIPFAKVIIVYRTSLSDAIIEILNSARAKVYFEFDDLIVGERQLRNSGIQSSLTDKQFVNLLIEGAALRETALVCDEIIVSTNYLKECYVRDSSDRALSGKKYHVINNYLMHEDFRRNQKKDFDFVFTSPSQSITPELSMVVEFLKEIDKKGICWRLLIIGNNKAFKEIARHRFKNKQLILKPYSEYSEYLDYVSTGKYVLIPMSHSRFNMSKTAIRGYDALIAGSVPLMSPVGEYNNFSKIDGLRNLIIDGNNWRSAISKISRIEQCYEQTLSKAQDELAFHYGAKSAISSYKDIFQ